MLRVYRSLLYLYPARYHREFGEEMVWVFDQARRELRNTATITRSLFLAREIGGLLVGALHEHWLNMTGAYDWYPQKRFDMRSEFRFPRSVVILMLVIFLGIVLALEASRSIQLRHGSGLELISFYSQFWQTLGIGLALASAAAVAGWVVLFALGRSGIHRLSHLETWSDDK